MMRAEKRMKTLRFNFIDMDFNVSSRVKAFGYRAPAYPACGSFPAGPRSEGPVYSCRGPVRMGEERFRKTFQRRRGRALHAPLPGRADDPGVESALHLQHRLDHAPGHPRGDHRLARILLGELDILQPRLPDRLPENAGGLGHRQVPRPEEVADRVSVEPPVNEQTGRRGRDILRRDHGERHVCPDRAPVDPLVADEGDAPEVVFHEVGRTQAYHFRFLERVHPGFEIVQAKDRPGALGQVRPYAAQGDDARNPGLLQGRHEGRADPVLVLTEIGGVVSRRYEDEGPTGSREGLLQKRAVTDVARPRLRPLRGQRSETDPLPPDDA